MASSKNWKRRFSSMNQKLKIPYNPYLAHRALSKLEFPIGNIYCIIPKKRTPLPLQLSTIINSISHKVGQNSIILKQIYTKVLSKQQNFIGAFIKELQKSFLKNHKRKK